MTDEEEDALGTERETCKARDCCLKERLSSLLARRDRAFEVTMRRERVEGIEDDQLGGMSVEEQLNKLERFFAASGPESE